MSNLRPPKGVRVADWRTMLDAAANAIADADMDPSRSGPEEYAAAALRAALRLDRSMWRDVADRLAERVANYAECAGEECPHPESKPDPDNCAFCADRAAYQMWQRKSGRNHRPAPAAPAEVLDVFAANRRDARDEERRVTR